jgi:hypothetical protein
MRVGGLVSMLVLLMVLPLAGCGKKAKAEFNRPAAVSTVPEPEEPPPEPPDTEAEPEITPEPEEKPPPPEEEKPPPRRVRAPKPEPPPEPEPPADPPEPRLTSSTDSAEARPILEKLARTEDILSSLGRRTLTTEQQKQAANARAFVSQAKQALDDGDYRRAAVLADKGIILAEDLRDSTRSSR